MNFRVFSSILALTFAFAAPTVSAAPRSEGSTIPRGKWGGEHVTLEVSASGAVIQFDCAHGAIPAPLALDSNGRFQLSGDFVAEHGGPIRVGEVEKHQAVRYSGRVRGRTMTLSVELGGDQEGVGPFTLELGSDGRIVRCR
ncbi:MAG TPA: hypothetical protein VFS34_03965 [Thermoanaerobaculia bacterium]|nr:hypothetical protein [Thermoanaerobaculia bacterium]